MSKFTDELRRLIAERDAPILGITSATSVKVESAHRREAIGSFLAVSADAIAELCDAAERFKAADAELERCLKTFYHMEPCDPAITTVAEEKKRLFAALERLEGNNG